MSDSHLNDLSCNWSSSMELEIGAAHTDQRVSTYANGRKLILLTQCEDLKNHDLW